MRHHLPLALLASLAACTSGADPKDTDTDAPSGSDDTDVEADVPEIDELSEDQVLVGDTLVLEGTLFGDDEGTVTIGGEEADIEDWSDDEIEVIVPDVFPGRQEVVVERDDGEESDEVDVQVVLPDMVYVLAGLDSSELNDELYAYAVGEGGGLTELDESPFDIGVPSYGGFGGVPGSLALDLSHRRLYAAGAGSIGVMDIDPRTGELTMAGEQAISVSNGGVFSVVVSPDGRDLYVGRGETTDIAHYTLDEDGTFDNATPDVYASGGDVADLRFTPDGRFLVGTDGNLAILFERDPADGTLTAAPGAGTWDDDLGSYGLALSPDGERLYVAAYTEQYVYGYALGDDGSRTALPGAPYTFSEVEDGSPNGLAFSPDGDMLYVSMWTSDEVAWFSVAEDGSLTLVDRIDSIEAPAAIAVSPNGTLLFSLGQDNAALQVFAIDDEGSLATIGLPVSYGPDYEPVGLVVTGP